MTHEELDSQLSAMFDGELAAPECELLARRLARDDVLRSRWGRYAAIGAAIRMEPGACSLAQRVSAAVAGEPSLLVGASRRNGNASAGTLGGWRQTAVGAVGAVAAAAVAGVAVFFLHASAPTTQVVPQVGVTQISEAAPAVAQASDESSAADGPQAADASSVPVVESASFAPPVELADFLLAHSEFSMPFLRRSALSALVTAESVDSVDSDSAAPGGPQRDAGGPDAQPGTGHGTAHAAQTR